MKKIFLLMAALVLALSLAACSSKGGDGDKAGKITIWTQAAADHPEGKMFADRVKTFNEEHPDGPKVEIQNITRAGAGSGYIDKLNAAITASDMPDIFTLDGPDIAAYADSGVIGEVDPYLSDGFKKGFTQAIIDQGTVDGKLYGMGYSDSGVAIMYNEDMINALPDDIKALIPSKDQDWTWDQFVTLARKIDEFAKKSNDPAFAKYETAVSTLLTDVSNGVYETGTYFYTPILWGNGANIVDEDGLTVDGVLNSSKSVDALTKYSQLFKEPALATASESEKAFHSGKTALSVSGFWYVNELINNYPDLKFRTVRYPKMSENYDGLYTPSGSWAFVRNGQEKDEKRIKQVVEVMEWLTNDEAAKEYYHKNGSIPTRINSISEIDTNTDNLYHNEAWTVLKYQVENTNKARPVSPGYPYLSETFAKDVLLKIAQNKTTDSATIKKYVDDAAKKIDKELEKYRK
ncbi:sugar ABC transporter substrate-binding protein [Bacillus sp. FJAT-29814]|uniref:ABC transporter substrate-binding protein n=1 Tax=Bacillus sp. FJAT-29814 TaxID=1729688 RepID=UPI0008373CB7|nr:sugar ABC transporter substrate-binding protein [Bacillus sp. FJAT-29814]